MNKQIQTYIYYQDKCFFVSTITRQSSASPELYNETIVWNYDSTNNERKEMLFQDEDSQGSIRTHLKICDELFYFGHKES